VVTLLAGKCPTVAFTVNGYAIVTTGSTDFKRGNCGQLQNSRGVTVNGLRLPSGVVQATDVELWKGNDATVPE
jgi:uncharacterized protein DUF5666